jgi:hypothetical protein
MGLVMRRSKQAAIHAARDDWTTRAFAACVGAAKDMTGLDGPIRPLSPIGKLDDVEWGWTVATIVWTWIATRAAQAVAEGWNEERAIRATGLDPDPWFDGAIESILPQLPEACPDLDWSKPVAAWTKDEVIAFVTAAITLTRRAVAARNVVEEKLANKLETVDSLLSEICPFDGARA